MEIFQGNFSYSSGLKHKTFGCTVIILLSPRGAYLIQGLLKGGLIEGGGLSERGAYLEPCFIETRNLDNRNTVTVFNRSRTVQVMIVKKKKQVKNNYECLENRT